MRVISGKARGVTLKTPEGLQTRPTAERVKEALFSIIQFEIPGARVLDLFGGTGQLGIEALSRGAKSAVFVDAGEPACKLIRENLRRTKLEADAKVIRSDYLEYLKRCREGAQDVVKLCGWTVVHCGQGDGPRTIEDIHDEVLGIVEKVL